MTREYHDFDQYDASTATLALQRFNIDCDGEIADRASELRTTISSCVEAFGHANIPLDDHDRSVIRGSLSHAYMRAMEDDRPNTAQSFNELAEELGK